MSREIFDEAVSDVCGRIKSVLVRLPAKIKSQVQEIRLRVNKPVTLSCRERIYFVTSLGEISNYKEENLLIFNEQDISESFQNICDYSVYSHQEEIKNGYVTIKGGHRVGICGTAVRHHGEITGIKDISSLNIRVSRQILGISKEVIGYLEAGTKGTMLVGAPCCGKTTLLRDIARVFSNGDLGYIKKVAVVDERGEIAAVYEGVCQNDLGLCDILDGYPKGEGVMQAIRTLSPEIIVCDEIGNISDLMAIEESLNAGVVIIASMHARNIDELLKRPQAKRLLRSGAFGQVVLMKDRTCPGCVENIYKTGELIDKIGRINSFNLNRKYIGVHSFS